MALSLAPRAPAAPQMEGPSRGAGVGAMSAAPSSTGYVATACGTSVVALAAARHSKRPRAAVTARAEKSSRRHWPLLSLGLVLGPLLSPALAAERWDSLCERYAPNTVPVTAKSGEAEVALAKHLKEKDVLIFCTWFSRDCQELREIFGKEAAALAPFVECADKDRNFLTDRCPQQTPNLMWEKKSNGEYPLWSIGEEFFKAQDEISLADAAKITNFKEFPLSQIRTESDFESTRYIWS